MNCGFLFLKVCSFYYENKILTSFRLAFSRVRNSFYSEINKNKMKSISRRFNYMKDKYRDSDDYANFQRAVEGQGFTRKAMSLGFNKLVGKDKYDNNAKT